jgi:hypothetical protein
MSLTGVWTNELRSVMLLREDADHGLTGLFRSLVGRDSDSRTIVGRTSSEDGGKRMIGFAVCFEIATPGEGYGPFSVCSWSGWAEKDELGAELIKTHWLLTASVLQKEKQWAATRVGEDVFAKISKEPDERLLKDFEAVKARYSEAKRTRN